MPSKVALILCLALVAWLFYSDAERKRASAALWIPTIWVLIIGSRMVSQWLGTYDPTLVQSPDFYLEGSPLDRDIFLALIVIGIYILFKRKPEVARILKENKYIFILLLFGGISIFWSDFPLVSFKRWTKSGLGTAVMVLIILTDAAPVASVKILMRRASYVFIPFSLLLIKYFPDLGRTYSIWTWTPYYTGVSDTKNGLGYICMLSGLFYVWNLLSLWRQRKTGIDHVEWVKTIAFLLMTLWLLKIANSATSLMGMLLGTAILFLTERLAQKKLMPMFNGILAGSIALIFVFNQAFGLKEMLLRELGRDDTLTGRTDLWSDVLHLQTSPFLGTGYGGFWLGERVEKLWKMYLWHPNQAHNGYLQTYLDLGLVGLMLLSLAAITAYLKIVKNDSVENDYGRFRLAILLVVLVYNFTEAAFNGPYLMWFMFLLVVLHERYLGQEQPSRETTAPARMRAVKALRV